jgi:lysyl-tRNA synthetase class I
LLRFAPSPTGDLHIGNLRVALINHILSKQLNDTTKSLGENPSDLFFKSRKVRRGPGE